MATFRYQARDPFGRTHPVTIQASSRQHAMEIVRNAEGDVDSIERVHTAIESPGDHEPESALPPLAPREIPPGVTGMAGGSVLLIVGGLFVGVSVPVILTGIGLVLADQRAGVFLALIPLVHLVIGVAMLIVVAAKKRGRTRLYQHGEAMLGTVERVGLNHSVRINGRHPHQINWTYEIDGRTFSGKRSTRNEAIMSYDVGDRLWVVVDPNDSSRSAEWPPV